MVGFEVDGEFQADVRGPRPMASAAALDDNGQLRASSLAVRVRWLARAEPCDTVQIYSNVLHSSEQRPCKLIWSCTLCTANCSTFVSVTSQQLPDRTFMNSTRPKVKTATMTLRVDPKIKAAVEAAARREHRSITSLIEVLILNHCRSVGLNPVRTSEERNQ